MPSTTYELGTRPSNLNKLNVANILSDGRHGTKRFLCQTKKTPCQVSNFLHLQPLLKLSESNTKSSCQVSKKPGTGSHDAIFYIYNIPDYFHLLHLRLKKFAAIRIAVTEPQVEVFLRDIF